MAKMAKDDKIRMEKDLYPTSAPPEQQPPPSYTINPSDLTAAFSNLTLGPATPTPTPDQCIAHLKLLEAFHQLREDVATTDGLFGINDSLVPANQPETQRTEILRRVREKRWAVYVARAATRFEKWWEMSVEPGAVMISQTVLTEGFWYTVTEKKSKTWRISREQLPPLGMSNPGPLGDSKCSIDSDVIMVWHSYMLNPRCFLEDCLRYNKIGFWKSGFPWDAIDSCIDSTSFEFTGTTQAQQTFTQETGLAWNNLDDPLDGVICCPKCKQPTTYPWTTSGNCSSWSNDGGEIGDGIADKNFAGKCLSCRQTFDHEVLRACKFRKDVERLLLKDVPMPGTVLKIDGTINGMMAIMM